MDPREEIEMSGSDEGAGTEVEAEAPVLQEGDADWRPWSGGHESPLEGLWQWMMSKGVGGLKGPKAEKKGGD